MVITPNNAHQLHVLGQVKHGWVTQVVWSPDGRTLAVAHAEGVALYVNGFGGMPTHMLPHPAPAKSVAFHPTRPLIATASKDTLVRLWTTPDKALELRGHTNAVNSVAISPSGNLLLSASSDKTLRLWDIGDSQNVTVKSVFEGHHTDEISSVAFSTHAYSDDYGIFASGSWDRTLRLWDLAGAVYALGQHNDWVRQLALNGKLLASASKDEHVRLWQTHDHRQLRVDALIHAHPKGADSAALNADNTLLATGGRDNLIRLWDIQKLLHRGKAALNHALLALHGHDKPVLTLAFNPAGTMLASGSGDNTVRLWGL
jgi:WD40 repeat protein